MRPGVCAGVVLFKLLLAALLAIPAAAQEVGQFNSACFLGLDDANSPAVLGPCESPDLLNVESNLDGTAILKRKGYAKTADLTVSTSPVNGSYSFIDSNGNKQDIVCQDRNCAKSTNGNAFSVFLTTATPGVTRWSFVDQGGILYGANSKRDAPFKYDGTNLTYPAGMPLGSILELTQDRLAVGDIATLPNRVHYSSAGAYEQFSVGVNPEDSFFDDVGAAGDRIRGIKCIGGNCYIFKTASITLCEMADQYNTQCSVVSPVIGTTDPSSIVAAGNSLYFRAQDKSYWEIAPQGLHQISKKIPNLVKSQSGGLSGGENTNTQTTQADWQAGTQSPSGTFNTISINGSIFPSSSTFSDASTAAFVMGTMAGVSTTSAGLVISSNNYLDTFSDGDFTSGRTTWTLLYAAPSIASIFGGTYLTSQTGSDDNNAIYTTALPISSGTWSFIHRTHGECSATTICFSFRFMQKAPLADINNPGDYYEAYLAYPQTIGIRKYIAGVGFTQFVTIPPATIGTNYPVDTDNLWTIEKQGSNFVLSINGVWISSGTDSAITSSLGQELVFSRSSNANYFTNIRVGQYNSIGQFTSRIYDTSFSTPIWGLLSATVTLPANTQNVAFYVRGSSSPNNDLWSGYMSSSDTLRASTQTLRYAQYRADFTTSISTQTPTLRAIGLGYASTGTFTTACIQPNSSISAWGTLSCAQTLAGAGNEVFYATSAATCAALPTSAPTSWQTSLTNNATVTIATNTAVKIGWRSLLGSATDQAQVDACVLSWNEGTPAQPVWAAYDSVKNAVYFTSTINGAAATNRLLKYDRNLEEWFPWDISAQAPRFINNTLYFGGASAGTWNSYGTVDADAGAAISGYWRSKDVGSDKPFQEKSFKTLSILSRNNGTGNMTGTWTLSNAQTGDYTISLATGTGISYARSNFNLPIASPQQFMNVKVGNNSSTPFEVLGIGLTWQVLGWRVSGP